MELWSMNWGREFVYGLTWLISQNQTVVYGSNSCTCSYFVNKIPVVSFPLY